MNILCFLITAALSIQCVVSADLPDDVPTVLANNVRVPKTKSNFAKNNVTAKWASEYPKEWGSEDYSYQLGEPEPDSSFNAVITEDHNVLAIFNNSHVQLIDLAKNASASIIQLDVPERNFVVDVNMRPDGQGGYDLFHGVATYIYDNAATTFRQRLGSDLQPIGTPIAYEGQIGTISKQGTMVTLEGKLYDLSNTDNTSTASLTDPYSTDFSFSPDGVHLASVSYTKFTADLWNATSGEKIFAFPISGIQNWVARFSPDGKFIAFCLGSSNNTIQIYELSNLTAPPVELNGFQNWPRQLAWSPTSHQIAVGSTGKLQLFNVPSREVAQTWEVDYAGSSWEASDLVWFDNGNKISWEWQYAKYLYDFEQNTEWLWNIRNTDHSWGPSGLYVLEEMGYAVTVDGDATVRFWGI